MNKFFLTLIACMLMSANARFFRGADLLKTGKDFLRSVHLLKGSADFQGDAHYEHTHRGDVEHKATESGMTTEAHITSDIAINLGAKMPGYIAQIREILETQVDTGVTFCGNPYERTSGAGARKKLSEIVGTDPFSPNHAYTDSAVANDGVVAKQSQITETDDVHQCGNSNCVSGSIVASVASFIRAQGYHVNHADICRARGTVADVTSRTCNLVTAPSLVKQFNCKKKTGFSDQWKYDRECAAFGVNYRVNADGTANTGYNSATGSSPCDATTGAAANCVENDDTCIYDPAKVAALDSGNLCVEDIDNAIVPFPCSYLAAGAALSDSAGAACVPVHNQLKRTLKYGLITGGKADIDDAVVVTGAADGCTSLRGIVLAINGNKLERTYVSKQHEAAEDYWQGQIDDTKAIVKTIREKIINLQGLGNYFYPLENSKKYECDSEFGPFENGIDAGGATDPRCDLAGTDYASFQGTPHTKSMALRSSCFCRSFDGSGDDFYLTTTEAPDAAFCDTNFEEKLPSVYTYCLLHKQLGETNEWKNALSQLLFSPNDVPTNLNTWFNGASDEIKKNFEDSVAGQGTKCGRVSTADPASVKFSNKGGNCIPLEGVQDIVYRLEYEFFNADAAVDRKGNGDTYADKMCVANPGGDQVLSFRQLSYVWQRMGAVTANELPAETDDNSDDIHTNDPKAQFYDDSNTTAGAGQYEDFCTVDYTQMLGGGKAYEDAGMKVADPLDFLSRVNSEASENVEATANAKNNALESEDRLWSKLSDELTLDQAGRIIKKIGDRAAAHFKRVNSHEVANDVIGNIPLCKPKVIASGAKVEARGFYSCEDIKEFSTAAGVGITTPFEVQKWAFYGAKNLETLTLPGQVTVAEMALRNIGADKTVNFASNKYEGEGDNSISLDVHSLSHGTKCGVTCDVDYSPSQTASHALCELNSAGVQTDLNAASCNFDNAVFAAKDNSDKKNSEQQDYNDGTADRFLSKSIDRNTKLECAAGSTGLKVIDVKLPADCGKLTIGDLSECAKLSHIYIKKDAGCALTQLDVSGAKIGAGVRFIWSNNQDLVDKIKDETDFSSATVSKLAFGVANTITHVGGAGVTDGEACSKETVIPAGSENAVRQLLKLPFAQGTPAQRDATATFKCLNATGAGEDCVFPDDVTAAQGLHSGFLCEIDTNDAQKITCNGGKIELKSDYVPTAALVDLWNASNSASCANADAEKGANNKCAFGGIQSDVALPAAGSKSNLGFTCVEANGDNNQTQDRVCGAQDRTDAASAHYGFTCTTPDSVNAICLDWNDTAVNVAQFADQAECDGKKIDNVYVAPVPAASSCKDPSGNVLNVSADANQTECDDQEIDNVYVAPVPAASSCVDPLGNVLDVAADANQTECDDLTIANVYVAPDPAASSCKDHNGTVLTVDADAVKADCDALEPDNVYVAPEAATCDNNGTDVPQCESPVVDEQCTLGEHTFNMSDSHHVGQCDFSADAGDSWPKVDLCKTATGGGTPPPGRRLNEESFMYTTIADSDGQDCNQGEIINAGSVVDGTGDNAGLAGKVCMSSTGSFGIDTFAEGNCEGHLSAPTGGAGEFVGKHCLISGTKKFNAIVQGDTVDSAGCTTGTLTVGQGNTFTDAVDESCTQADGTDLGDKNQTACDAAAKSPNTFVEQGSTTAESCTLADNTTIAGANETVCDAAATVANTFVEQGSNTTESCTQADGSLVEGANETVCDATANVANTFVEKGSNTTESCTKANGDLVDGANEAQCAAADKSPTQYTGGTDNRAKIECVNAANADHVVVHIDPTVGGHELEVVSSSPWSPGPLADKANGAQSYLLSNDVTLTGDQLTKVCPKATEVILPDSVTKIGIGFVINLNTAAAGELTVYLGDSVAVAAPGISIAETAGVLPNDVNNVAAFFRRCPVDGDRKYEFDNLTPRKADGTIDRTAATAVTATKLHTMNDRSVRNLENGLVDTCLN